MGKFTEYSDEQDNITFSKILGGNAVDQRWTAGDISNSLNDEKIINAVQIDWNGANWESIPDNPGTPDEINTAYSGDSRSPIPMISVHSVGDLLYRRQS